MVKQDSVRKEKRLKKLEVSYSKKLKEFQREMKRNKTMISEMRLQTNQKTQNSWEQAQEKQCL